MIYSKLLSFFKKKRYKFLLIVSSFLVLVCANPTDHLSIFSKLENKSSQGPLLMDLSTQELSARFGLEDFIHNSHINAVLMLLWKVFSVFPEDMQKILEITSTDKKDSFKQELRDFFEPMLRGECKDCFHSERNSESLRKISFRIWRSDNIKELYSHYYYSTKNVYENADYNLFYMLIHGGVNFFDTFGSFFIKDRIKVQPIYNFRSVSIEEEEEIDSKELLVSSAQEKVQTIAAVNADRSKKRFIKKKITSLCSSLRSSLDCFASSSLCSKIDQILENVPTVKKLPGSHSIDKEKNLRIYANIDSSFEGMGTVIEEYKAKNGRDFFIENESVIPKIFFVNLIKKNPERKEELSSIQIKDIEEKIQIFYGDKNEKNKKRISGFYRLQGVACYEDLLSKNPEIYEDLASSLEALKASDSEETYSGISSIFDPLISFLKGKREETQRKKVAEELASILTNFEDSQSPGFTFLLKEKFPEDQDIDRLFWLLEGLCAWLHRDFDSIYISMGMISCENPKDGADDAIKKASNLLLKVLVNGSWSTYLKTAEDSKKWMHHDNEKVSYTDEQEAKEAIGKQGTLFLYTLEEQTK